MFDFNDDDIRKAAQRMTEAAQKIQERLLKDAMFGERPPYSSFTSTRTMRPSIPPSTFFKPTAPLFTVITSLYAVEKRKQVREVKRTFWQKLWASLTDLNPWSYSPIEYYEVNVPGIMIDKLNHQIICHPSLEQEIKKAVSEGRYEPTKR